ncbi:hypothetical protein JW930_06740 [Candidatus Woesearchaeota archaeon]|nr:hypothetical protein [Candidatus Woesearchaeota archaeon]
MVPWYEKLDYEENPFTTNPKKFTECLVNVDAILEEIDYRISSGNMLVIIGKDGFGKTSLLMYAAKKFGGRRRVVHVDCELLDKNLNITKVLQEKYGIIGRLFNKKPRNMILLLDNVQNLSKQNNDRIKYYYDQGYIRSIIFTTDNLRNCKFSPSLKDRIGSRIVKINDLDEDDAINLIQCRVEDEEFLTGEQITKLFSLSDKNPFKLLEICERVAEHAVKKSRGRVQQIDIDEVLGEKK